MKKTHRVALLAVFTAMAMGLGWLESFLPPLLPGMKPGLANIAAVFVLYRLGWKDAALVSAVRVLLSCLLFGLLVSLAYSAVGAALSLTCMALLKKTGKFSCVAVSAAGGAAHNLAQILMAWLLTATGSILLYLPLLLAAGTAAGIFVGLIAGIVIKRVAIAQ